MAEADEKWIAEALVLARYAETLGEVPVGAVLIVQGELIAQGWNQCISTQDPTAHAEIIALRQAGLKLNNYRLVDAELYTTLEPCAMCAGALIHARIKRLVYGATDPKAGAVGSILNILTTSALNHKVDYQGGILEEACGRILKNFFKERRQLNHSLKLL